MYIRILFSPVSADLAGAPTHDFGEAGSARRWGKRGEDDWLLK